MTPRNQAITTLREAKAIMESAAGSQLHLTMPPRSAWEPANDNWAWVALLYYAADDHNNDRGGPAVADIQRISRKVQKIYNIEDSELA